MTTFNDTVRKNPKKFFKRIGLTEMTTEAAEHALTKAGGRAFHEQLETAREGAKEKGDWQAFYELLCRDPNVFTANAGPDVPRIVQAAELIARMTPVPGMRVLDLGGGPGHLAFWTAEVWPQAQVTVLDPHGGQLGEKWARQLRTDRVTFETGNWESLNPEQHGPFDFAVVSGMLGLHAASPAFADEAAFRYDQADHDPLTPRQAQGIVALRNFLKRLTPVMDLESSLLLIEMWTPSSARLLAHALEDTEWGFDIVSSAPSRGGDKLVSLFMLTRGQTQGREYARAAANAVTLPEELQTLTFTAADSFRRAFRGEVQGHLAVKYRDGHIMRVEVFEGEGLGGVYEYATTGFGQLRWGSLFHLPQYHSVLAEYDRLAKNGELTLVEASGPLFDEVVEA